MYDAILDSLIIFQNVFSNWKVLCSLSATPGLTSPIERHDSHHLYRIFVSESNKLEKDCLSLVKN